MPSPAPIENNEVEKIYNNKVNYSSLASEETAEKNG